MNTIAKVKIWGYDVGAVAWIDSSGYASFEFYNDFLNKGLDLSPLKMPVEEARSNNKIFSFPSLNAETFKGLPGLLADSLPDKFGNKIIDSWLARQGRDQTSFNSVERLCYTGKRGMGALEYEPAASLYGDDSGQVDIKKLVKLAAEILNDRNEIKINIRKKTSTGLEQIIKVGTSAGGARAKAVIAYNETTGDVRSGQIDNLSGYEYWIIKFDGVTNKELGDSKGYGKIEYAYYLMAKACGINMSYSRLLNENGRSHFMTKRFDRTGIEKHHMQTLCALEHFDYNDPLSYSYEQAFQTIRKLKLFYLDSEELYRRMVFNVIAKNNDDHTKNISFLMDKNAKWSLSPAYDVTFAFNPANRWIKSHRMSINGKRDDITKEDLICVAKNMNIKKPNEIIEQIKDTVSSWNEFAKTAGVNRRQAISIHKTHDLMI
ncbi:MAG: type II toxin-antitoxin system HipA family toxin [Ignavibacteria bacterium]|nr:type II toxin-antitoxin system HipA family toxin [Ignavibacteria bacterium]